MVDLFRYGARTKHNHQKSWGCLHRTRGRKTDAPRKGYSQPRVALGGPVSPNQYEVGSFSKAALRAGGAIVPEECSNNHRHSGSAERWSYSSGMKNVVQIIGVF